MAVTVLLPYALREYADGAAELTLRAATAGEALSSLVERYPRLRRHLFSENGALRGHVRVYRNEHEITGPEEAVENGDTLMIVPSIAGGAGAASAFERDEIQRYARHITLPEVGWEGQEKLRSARVLVVGAGGLGSPIGLYLAAAGVGTIGLVDFDDVDLSNLQRQVMFATDDIGRAKVDAAKDRLHGVNPHVRVVTHRVRLTSDNALDILKDYDVVIDGTDNFPTRYLVNDACVLLDKPYVYGSIYRFEGQVAVFGGRKGPCYRCLFREPPPPGLVPSCAEGGVLGVLPGIIGSLQALEALKIVLGTGRTLEGRIALFDALSFRWRELRLARNASCPVCGDEPTITELIDYEAFCGVADTTTTETTDMDGEITPAQLKQRIETGEPLQLIDIREPFEWNIANLGEHGARLISLGDLPDQMDELNREQDIVLYCRTGSRSQQALEYMRAAGFQRVSHLRGGITAWANEIDPSMPTY